MLDIIFAMGGGTGIPANKIYKILLGTGVFKFGGSTTYLEFFDTTPDDFTPAASRLNATVSITSFAIGIRNGGSSIGSNTPYIKQHYLFYGDYNYDNIRIEEETLAGRVEVRNENGVLITDNGVAWPDGTYPPDAKNRAGLAGLHAAPAVINPELETALMGDETDKERVQE